MSLNDLHSMGSRTFLGTAKSVSIDDDRHGSEHTSVDKVEYGNPDQYC
jgi:hypothetical protein